MQLMIASGACGLLRAPQSAAAATLRSDRAARARSRTLAMPGGTRPEPLVRGALAGRATPKVRAAARVAHVSRSAHGFESARQPPPRPDARRAGPAGA